MSELPTNWATTKLTELAEDISYGYTASSTQENIGPHLLRITDIQNNHVSWGSVPFCEIDQAQAQKYLLKENDLVFARTGATVGKSFLIKGEIPESVFASYLIRVRCLRPELASFLAYYFRSPDYWLQITKFSAGIGQPNVNGSKLKELNIPLPPLAEQASIAKKLDELLAQVDTLKARIDAIPALLKRFRQSALAAAVSGRLTENWRSENPSYENQTQELLSEIEQERKLAFQADMDRVGKNKKYKPPVAAATEGLPEVPTSWSWVSVDSLASKVVDGVHKKPDYKDGGIPFITVKNLTASNGISFKDTKFVSSEDHEEFYKRANPEKGDILISKDGTLGVIRQVKTDAEFSIFVSVALVKPALRSTSNYLEIAFKSPQVQAQMIGVGSGLQHIHLTDLKQDCIPLPPKNEQTEIVRRVEQLFAYADQLEAKVASAKSRIDHLAQSILAKAFRGELVPQDPNDEPASVLLGRIKAQRAAAPKAKRGRKVSA